jgi:hypothetical protein
VELGAVAPPPASPDRARSRRRRRAVVLVLVGTLSAGWLALRGRSHTAPADGSAAPPADERAQRPTRLIGDSLRITVEVVNATAVRGLGRTATAWLRDVGFDVVNTTTAPEAERLDSSVVRYGTGHPEWAAIAAKAIGGARIEARPDSLRYLDLTVLVGRSWRPPPQTLYP